MHIDPPDAVAASTAGKRQVPSPEEKYGRDKRAEALKSRDLTTRHQIKQWG